MDCNPLRWAPLCLGIFQARILEWVAISSCRGSSQPRDQTHVSCTGWQVLYHQDSFLSHRVAHINVYVIEIFRRKMRISSGFHIVHIIILPISHEHTHARTHTCTCTHKLASWAVQRTTFYRFHVRSSITVAQEVLFRSSSIYQTSTMWGIQS